VILPGEPVWAEEVGWKWIEMMVGKEIAEFIPYKLSRGCPRWARKGENTGDLPKCAFSVSSRRDKKRKPAPSAEKTVL
jgi:hypothetical protein